MSVGGSLRQNIIFVIIRGLNSQTVGIKYVNNHLVGWRKLRLLLETRAGVDSRLVNAVVMQSPRRRDSPI